MPEFEATYYKPNVLYGRWTTHATLDGAVASLKDQAGVSGANAVPHPIYGHLVYGDGQPIGQIRMVATYEEKVARVIEANQLDNEFIALEPLLKGRRRLEANEGRFAIRQGRDDVKSASINAFDEESFDRSMKRAREWLAKAQTFAAPFARERGPLAQERQQ